MSFTLKEAHEAGWEGQRAKDFVAWRAEVEKLFSKRFGVTIDEILGDWPSADTFTSGFDAQEAVDYVAELAHDEWGTMWTDAMGLY